MADRDERFLSRWARLKQRARDDEAPEAAAEAASAAPAPVSATGEEEDDREARENRRAAEAIDIDALGYGDDFSPFMKRGVPETLRRRALRKFFASDPLLANLDGLNDYDEDYNNPEHMVYRSAWDVARGFLTEAEKTAQQATGRLSPAVEPGTKDATDDVPFAGDDGEETPSVTPAPESEMLPQTEPEEQTLAVAAPEGDPAEEDEPAPAPRRVSIRRRLDG